MESKECIAVILAGGQGTRLGPLTKNIAKPAVPFGGKHRLIDFTLSNCFNSHIDTVGILTTAHPFNLLDKITWQDKNGSQGSTNVYTLPPQACSEMKIAYTGTANAVYANALFIESFNPEFVLILSGDHIYKMEYTDLLRYHKEKGAAATIAVINVLWAEASRFGIMTVHSDGVITKFAEKPVNPTSNLASMGVYIFTWSKLKEYLLQDDSNKNSTHDFGKNIIPAMLDRGERLYAYPFEGYWKDVGTVESLYDAHMDLLAESPPLSLTDSQWPIYTTTASRELDKAVMLEDKVRNSLLHTNSIVYGNITESVVFSGVRIGRNATVKNSVVMPGAIIGEGAYLERALVGPGAVIEEGYSLQGGADGVPAVAVGNQGQA